MASFLRPWGQNCPENTFLISYPAHTHRKGAGLVLSKYFVVGKPVTHLHFPQRSDGDLRREDDWFGVRPSDLQHTGERERERT